MYKSITEKNENTKTNFKTYNKITKKVLKFKIFLIAI